MYEVMVISAETGERYGVHEFPAVPRHNDIISIPIPKVVDDVRFFLVTEVTIVAKGSFWGENPENYVHGPMIIAGGEELT